MEPQPLSRTPSIIAAVVIAALIIVSGIFATYYYQTQSTIQARNTSINSLNGQITSDTTQITRIQSNVTSLQSQIASDLTSIISLQQQAKVNASQIAALNNQISSDDSQITSLNNQLPPLQSQINQLTTIVSLGSSTAELYDTLVTIPIGAGQATVVQFTAAYAGYVSIHALYGTGIFSAGLGGGGAGTRGPLTTGIQITESGGSETSTTTYRGSYSAFRTSLPSVILPGTGYFDSFNSTTNYTITFPVIPGTINVILGTSDTSIPQYALLTVTYYY